MGPDAQELLAELPEHLLSQDRRFSPTGWERYDKECGGLEYGTLTVVGGRPSQGKTAIGLHLAIQAALEGFGALVVSVEMTARGLAERLVCMVGGHSTYELRKKARAIQKYRPNR